MKVYAVIVNRLVYGIYSDQEMAIENLHNQRLIGEKILKALGKQPTGKYCGGEQEDYAVVEFELDKADTGHIVY